MTISYIPIPPIFTIIARPISPNDTSYLACYADRGRRLSTTAILCLILVVLLGNASANASEHCYDTSNPRYVPAECEKTSSGDFQKGLDAYDKGDYATDLREFRPLAEQWNAHAQNELGKMYNYGQGVPENAKTAVKWYALAAEQGYLILPYKVEELPKRIA